jgi:hypothetical protein
MFRVNGSPLLVSCSLVAILLALGALAVPHADAAAPKRESGPAVIQRAKDDFLRGQFAHALDLLDQFAKREDLSIPGDMVLGWEVTARSLVATREATNAKSAFVNLLRYAEDWRPEASKLRPFSDAETAAFEMALEERQSVDTIALPGDTLDPSLPVDPERALRAPGGAPPAPAPRNDQAFVIVTTVPRGAQLNISTGAQVSPFGTLMSDTFFTVPAPRALRIVAEKPGYVFHDSSFSVNPGDTMLVQLEPGRPDPSVLATIELSSDAPMNVFLDGTHKGSTSADSVGFTLEVAPGPHFVHVTSDYGISCDWPLMLEPAEVRTLRASFLGRIRVTTSERVQEAEVTIESQRLKGKLTLAAGATSDGLWPGAYTLRFRCKNCRSRNRDDLVREVVVSSGTIVDCNFDVIKQH